MKKLAESFKVINGKIQLYDINGDPIDGKDAYWEGTFICSHYNLTNLEGAPSEVNGDFNCRNNDLSSLIGAPNIVNGYFDCNKNNLTSLMGKPKVITGWFYSDYKTKIERALKVK
jgi:hypothetical protein